MFWWVGNKVVLVRGGSGGSGAEKYREPGELAVKVESHAAQQNSKIGITPQDWAVIPTRPALTGAVALKNHTMPAHSAHSARVRRATALFNGWWRARARKCFNFGHFAPENLI